MANKNQKHKNKQDQQPTPQPTAPATPLELSEEELEQVSGGSLTFNTPIQESASTGPGGWPALYPN